MEPSPRGAESDVFDHADRSSISGGIFVLHVFIGSPNTRARRVRRCAATESPNRPAPTTATSVLNGVGRARLTGLEPRERLLSPGPAASTGGAH